MAHIPHALGLPEITLRVAQYLELDDFKACSLVCKAFHDFYAPYIWENIHIGVFSLTDKRTKRIQEPQARLISFETDTADHSHQQGQLSREERFLQGIQEIAPWIRSLTIHSHHSPRQLRLGNQCTNISTLSIVAPPFNEQFGEDYWNECEALVLQNTTHLRSLTLIRWGKPCDNHQPTFPTPLWTPLITCAQHANLSELRIRDGTIRGQDSEAFWKICQQLEILELTKVNLEELLTPRDISSIGTSGGDDNRRGQVESILINKHATSAINALRPTTARFPKLRKLTMANLDLHPPLQMEHFVLHCPMLQTLNLRLKRGSSFPMGNFCDHFAAQSWPYLDALEISGQANDITGQEHALILQSTKRQFKCLDLKLGVAEGRVFTLLRQGGHFDTLTKVDFTLTPPPPHRLQAVQLVDRMTIARVSKWIVEVLESCRLLEHISGTIVHTQDVIDSKQWVCHGLKSFEVLIKMDASAAKDAASQSQVWNGVDRTNRCHQIFERLSQLKRLRVLSMNWRDGHHWVDIGTITTLRPLPLELGIGLECLSTLTDLEVVGIYDYQPTRMVDIEWMLEHWPKLRKITGSSFRVGAVQGVSEDARSGGCVLLAAGSPD